MSRSTVATRTRATAPRPRPITSRTTTPRPSKAAGAPRHRRLGLDDAAVLDLYRAMLVTRRLSQQLQTLAARGAIDVAIPSEGHEAAQVASIRALAPTDYAYLFYRSVPGFYGRGASAREIMLDSFGRADGPSSGGKNLPGHWAHRHLNLMTISGSVGTQIPNAVGTALACRIRGESAVTAVYFGDGAVSKADFHEGLNFAAIHKLPVVLVCENNEIAISVPFEKQSPVPRVSMRAAAYGVPGVTVDGSDALAVYEAMRTAVQRARAGGGPTLIEVRVARIGAHTSQVGDLRSEEERQAARERDPLPRLALYLRHNGLLDDTRQAEMDRAVKAEIEDAVAFAESAREPAAEEALQHVYKAA